METKLQSDVELDNAKTGPKFTELSTGELEAVVGGAAIFSDAW